MLWLHQASLGLQPGTMSGSWYQVPGARHYIREHSSMYVREYRVSTGYQSITCLLRNDITYKYAFIFSYLAPGAFVAVVVVEKVRKKSRKQGTKKKENRPQEGWDIEAPRTRTTPPKKVLVCCAFGLRTWNFVVVVVRIYLFSVDDFLYLLLFTLYA